jgi:hypothetical protein
MPELGVLKRRVPGFPLTDEEKAEDRAAELDGEYRRLVLSFGEAGYRSVFYTGPEHRLPLDPSVLYVRWRNAREQFVLSGSDQDKLAMESHVTMTSPPDADAVKAPSVSRRWHLVVFWVFVIALAAALAAVLVTAPVG